MIQSINLWQWPRIQVVIPFNRYHFQYYSKYRTNPEGTHHFLLLFLNEITVVKLWRSIPCLTVIQNNSMVTWGLNVYWILCWLIAITQLIYSLYTGYQSTTRLNFVLSTFLVFFLLVYIGSSFRIINHYRTRRYF